MSIQKKSKDVNIKIGKVTGQIHFGHGDINVTTFKSETKNLTKDDFLAAINALKAEIINEKSFLSENTKNKVIKEIDYVNIEAVKDIPSSTKMIQRLKKVKDVITAGTELATATSTAAAAAGKFIPLIQKVIDTIKNIF